MKYKTLLLLILFELFSKSWAIPLENETVNKYKTALNSITKILLENGSFKDAVFLTENTFSEIKFGYENYNSIITNYHAISNRESHQTSLNNYRAKDSFNYICNLSIFSLITKETRVNIDSLKFTLHPFTYNFIDPLGDQDWTNTFVTKMLATHQGNCRSLTYLYKILADELGAKCWFALAPGHIYIRNYSKQFGWYNTELTSGTFPTDAWIAATGYVNTDAIRSGVYMDTLSNQQSIGLCILDLAHGYIRQTNNYTDGFVLKCCNLVLQYHPVNPEALLIKGEALKRIYLQEKEQKKSNAPATYAAMEETFVSLLKLGYRQMPPETYQKWLKSVNAEKEKYINKQLKATSTKQ